MNLKSMKETVSYVIRELHSVESELKHCQDSFEILKSNVSHARDTAALLRRGLETNSSAELFCGYDHFRYHQGHFDSYKKMLREIDEISNNVSKKMQDIFCMLHFDLMRRVDFDDKNSRL